MSVFLSLSHTRTHSDLALCTSCCVHHNIIALSRTQPRCQSHSVEMCAHSPLSPSTRLLLLLTQPLLYMGCDRMDSLLLFNIHQLLPVQATPHTTQYHIRTSHGDIRTCILVDMHQYIIASRYVIPSSSNTCVAYEPGGSANSSQYDE